MKPVGRERENRVSRFNRGAVDNMILIDNPNRRRAENVHPRLRQPLAEQMFPRLSRTSLRLAGIGNTAHECSYNRGFEFATDDTILHIKRVRAHRDDVVDQVVDQVMGNRPNPPVFKRQFLL